MGFNLLLLSIDDNIVNIPLILFQTFTSVNYIKTSLAATCNNFLLIQLILNMNSKGRFTKRLHRFFRLHSSRALWVRIVQTLSWLLLQRIRIHLACGLSKLLERNIWIFILIRVLRTLLLCNLNLGWDYLFLGISQALILF